MLLIQLVKNPLKLGHFSTDLHMSVAERLANIATFESIPIITLIWG
jgi:hypothetical protein